MSYQKLMGNDVAIIFRPFFTEGEEWSGEYQVLLSVVGPVTMSQEDVNKLMSVASVVSSTVHLMETNEEACQTILENYDKNFGEEEQVFSPISEEYTDDFILTADTETYGGKQ